MKALYPGTFDPITLGHIDIIERACRLFSQVYIGVVKNTSKPTLFSFEERFHLVRASVKKFKNVKVEGFEGLVVDYARRRRIKVLIRGLRMLSDFEYEFQMALTNRKISSQIETIFLMSHPDYSYISSRFIKEVYLLGGDVSCFVPPLVIKAFRKKLKV